MTDPKMSEDKPSSGHVVGRYVLHAAIARGGMATVHIARLVGAEGFSRIVAAKRLHPELTEDPEFVAMFLDEARIASKVHHPNVVPVLDVVVPDDGSNEVILVQEYVHGVPLDKLFRAARDRGTGIPPRVAVSILAGVLAGLHSAHETKDEMGSPLGIIHRDVSPQNVIIGSNGIPRLLDFGIAKAATSTHVTREGIFKGKVAYMPAEQLRGETPARTGDLYSAGVVLWELLVGARMYGAKTEAELFHNVLTGKLPPLLEAAAERGPVDPTRRLELESLEPVVTKALSLSPDDRFATAEEMMNALVSALAPAPATDVARLVQDVAVDYMAGRERAIAANEESWRSQQRLVVAGAESAGSLGRAGGSGPRSISSLAASASPSSRPVPTSGPPSASPEPSSSAVGAALGPASQAEPKRKGSAALFLGLALAVACAVIAWMYLSGQKDMATPVTQGSATSAGLDAATSTGASSASTTSAAPSSLPQGSSEAASTALPEGGASASEASPVPERSTKGPAWHRTSSGAKPSTPSSAGAPEATTPTAKPPTDCDPPFFYEGTKKVFKPGCL